MKNKKGVMFFTVDALMAGIIFALTVILLLSFMVNVPVAVDANYYLEEYVDYITHTRMSQYRVNSVIYYDSAEKNPDLLVYQKILLMKEQNYPQTTIIGFIANFSNFVLPEHIGIEYEIDDAVIYSRHPEKKATTDIYLNTVLLTFVVDENSTVYGPNVTRITLWI
jgi:hypothetical protein